MIDFHSEEIFTVLKAALPDHSIIAPQGSGGQGVVMLARHRTANRLEAIKVLPLGLPFTPERKRLFEREIRALARLDHPHIVKLFDCGGSDGLLWFTMQQVDQGMSITNWQIVYEPGPGAMVERFLQVARALAHAHGRGVIHRDIKPSNILIRDDDDYPEQKGRVCVVDFGMAKIIEACADDDAGDAVSSTSALRAAGTLEYMSPEQVDGEPLDVRTDLYSLGVVMYEVLSAGMFPYTVNGIGKPGIARHIRSTEPLSLRGRIVSPGCVQVDPDLSSIVHKCLEKDRQRRYRSADELCDDLQAWQRGAAVAARSDHRLYRWKKAARRHWRPLVASLAFVLLLAAGTISTTLMWQRSQRLAATYRAGLGIYDLVQRGSDARDEGRTDEALALWHEALELDATAPLRIAEIDRMSYEIRHRLCEFHLVERDTAAARPYCDEALAVAEQYSDQPDLAWKRRSGFAEILRGRLALADKNYEAALTAFTHAVAIRRDLVHSDADNDNHRVRNKVDLASALSLAGRACRKLDRMAESFVNYQEVHDMRLALYEANPDSSDHALNLANSAAHMAAWHIVQKTPEHDQQALEFITQAEGRIGEMVAKLQCEDLPRKCRQLADDLSRNRRIVERRISQLPSS